jgi:hypothetical protein
MKATLHHSLRRALKIVRLVNKHFTFFFDVTVRCWDNGREQGLVFCVIGPDPKRNVSIFVAEARSSDQTVVVVDRDPNPFATRPSEAAWMGYRKYFAADADRQVVKFIRQQLEQSQSRRAARIR